MISRRGFFGSAVVAALFPREILTKDKSILTDADLASHIACHCSLLTISYINKNFSDNLLIRNPELNGSTIHIPERKADFGDYHFSSSTLDLANDVSIRSVCCEYPQRQYNNDRYFYRVEGGWKECLPNER